MLFSPKARCYSNVVAEMAKNGTPFADAAAEVAFRTWFDAAWTDSGCTQSFAILIQPEGKASIQFYLRGAEVGRRVNVYWGDGESSSAVLPTSGYTTTAHTYAQALGFVIVVIGDIVYFESTNSDGRSDFGGTLSNLCRLSGLVVWGALNTIAGSIATMRLTSLSVYGQNQLKGHVTMAAQSPGLCVLEKEGITPLSSADVNSILASVVLYSGEPKTSLQRVLTLVSNCGEPTGQGLNDIGTLIGLGWSVTTN